MSKSKKTHVSKEDALVKLQRYCAYQDRCHQEVRTKLLKIGIRGYDLEWVISELIQDKFLDEERFARSFVRGRYSQKKWGRKKIMIALRKKNVSTYCVAKGMEEIEEATYLENIRQLLEKKNATITNQNLHYRKGKLAQFLLTKGYESALIWEEINRLFPSTKGLAKL